jgi:hypothetical protein
MRMRQALKLHNEDEVTHKETGEVLRVLNVTQENSNDVSIEVVDTQNRYYRLSHLAIK